MTLPLEYDDVVKCPVQRPVSGLAGLFGMPLLLLVLVSISPAQINSSTASVGSGHSGSGYSGSGYSMSVAPPTGSIAPPTGSIAPRTGSVAPPTGFVHS